MKRTHDLSGAEKRKANKKKEANAVCNTRPLTSFLTVVSDLAQRHAAEGTDIVSETDDDVPCTSQLSPASESLSDNETVVDNAQPTTCCYETMLYFYFCCIIFVLYCSFYRIMVQCRYYIVVIILSYEI